MSYDISPGVTDIRTVGKEISEGIYEIFQYDQRRKYYDPVKKRLIQSIGRKFGDTRIFGSVDARFEGDPTYECLQS
jgi:hypothetical protein